MTNDDNDTQIAIIKIFAIKRANLFCLNIFGIKQITMILIINRNFISKEIFFQKNFKFKTHIQRKNILNLTPSPNKIPKIKGGKKYIDKIKSKLKRAKEPLRKIFFFRFLLNCFNTFHSHLIKV